MNGISHFKYLLLGAAGLFGILLLVGLPVSSALLFAVLLACPLMMLTGGHAGHGGSGKVDHTEQHDTRNVEGPDRSAQPHRHH